MTNDHLIKISSFFVVLALFWVATVQGQSSEKNLQFLVQAQDLVSEVGDTDVLILHVSADINNYLEGHIFGARFLDLNRIAYNGKEVMRDLPIVDSLLVAFRSVGINDGDRVVLYGDSNGMSASRAFFALDYLGFTSMALLDGGLTAWANSGGAVSNDAPIENQQGTLTAFSRPEKFVTAEQVSERLTSSLLIDARSEAEFSGEDPGNTILRGGHIPGAISINSANHLQDDGRLLPIDQLESLYSDGEGRHTIVYCRTGMKASHSYFVARLLGLDVSLYDGSFYDWSNLTEFPVEKGK
jgi:thiosulfate/3-mercaptopyruvate sulfurtransferase